MALNKKLLAGGLTLASLAFVLAAAGWYFLFRTDSPPPVSLDEALDSAVQPDEPPVALTREGLAGEWMLVQGGSSFTGYRVDQQVAGIGTETVVGRTERVEGSLNFDGMAIQSAEVVVDMTALRSDESLRDNVLRGDAIETADFPEASFVLTSPIVVNELPVEGRPVNQTVAGDLTLHGVTRPVEIDLQGVLRNGRLVVVGSEEIEFSDYDISPPRGPASVLSVEDHGIVELQLVFEKAA
jgi:polyisoprenoid-binding protein YceI